MNLKENEKVFANTIVSEMEDLKEKRDKNKFMKISWEQTIRAIDERNRKRFHEKRGQVSKGEDQEGKTNA